MITAIRTQSGPGHGRRRGAVTIEAAIALSLFCIFLVCMLDFTLASFRSQILHHIAHRVGREAIVHGPGAKSTWRGGVWGPTTYTTTLAGTDHVATVARTVSAGLPRSQVNITLSWPAGNNAVGSPVLVVVEMPWTPSLIRPLSLQVVTLQGRSRQYILH